MKCFKQRAILAAAAAALWLSGCGETPDLKEATPRGPRAALFNIDGEIPQFPDSGGVFGPFRASQYRLEELLRKATDDLQVLEVVVHFGAPELSFARAGELAEAIRKVSERGKTVTCHIDSADNLTYWLAARACPRILVSPAGGVDALGLSLEAVYVRDLLQSIGVSADIVHIGKYKDAAEPLVRDGMSPESREANRELLFDLHRLLVEGIAESRKMTAAKVQEAIDSGPHSAEEAVKLGLADQVVALETYLDTLRGKYAGGVDDSYGKRPAKQFSVLDLLKMLSEEAGETKVKASARIAIVPVIGPIMSGEGERFFGGMNIARDAEIARALSDAARDDGIKAVVLRIDSPGGSALASDNIWLAVRALAARKPVVASLGEVAASGGYYVASAATEAFASPFTITGSIGVVGGKIVLGDAASKYGVKTESIETGKRSGLSSPFRPFDEGGRAAIEKSMRSVYDLFVSRVAEGRKLDRAKVEAVAEGRAWSGTRAVQLGLVNTLGSLDAALARATALASQPPGIKVEILPKPKNFVEMLSELFADPKAMVFESYAGRLGPARDALALEVLLRREPVLDYAPLFFDIR